MLGGIPAHDQRVVHAESALAAVAEVVAPGDARVAVQVFDVGVQLGGGRVWSELLQRVDHDHRRIPGHAGLEVLRHAVVFHALRVHRHRRRVFVRRARDVADALEEHQLGNERRVRLHLRDDHVGARRRDRNVEPEIANGVQRGAERRTRRPDDDRLRVERLDLRDLCGHAGVGGTEMLGRQQRHVFEIRLRQHGGDVAVADLPRRIGGVERRDLLPALTLEIAKRRQDQVASADAGREYVAAFGRRNDRREAVVDRTVRQVERRRRLAERAERRTQHDRRMLREDRVVDLQRGLGVARVVVKNEVHGPALNAALLVHDPLEDLKFLSDAWSRRTRTFR